MGRDGMKRCASSHTGLAVDANSGGGIGRVWVLSCLINDARGWPLQHSLADSDADSSGSLARRRSRGNHLSDEGVSAPLASASRAQLLHAASIGGNHRLLSVVLVESRSPPAPSAMGRAISAPSMRSK